MEVKATGRLSFIEDGLDFFGSGIIIELFRQVGTQAWLKEMLNMSQKTSFNYSAQPFSTQPGIWSGPAAFRGLILVKTLLTLSTVSCNAW